jgi:hypothetical protein
MKKNRSLIYLLWLIAFFHLSSGCKVVENLLTFRIDNDASMTIPSAVGINTPLSIPTPEVSSQASQTFKNNNTDINKVKNVILERLNLTTTSPNQATFQFLKSIKIYISAPGLEEKLLASKMDIPTTVGNTLELETTSDAMDTYLKKETYSLRTEVVTRQVVGYETTIKAAMTFKVTANI